MEEIQSPDPAGDGDGIQEGDYATPTRVVAEKNEHDDVHDDEEPGKQFPFKAFFRATLVLKKANALF